METLVLSIVNNLPSDGLLNEEKEAIKELLPVPREQNVLWAKIITKSGYPSAYVITDKAFIYKISKDDVKDINKVIKEENKGKTKDEKKKKIKYLYQIIPWEHYSPELFPIEMVLCDSGDEQYKLVIGDNDISIPDNTLVNFFANLNNCLVGTSCIAGATSISLIDSLTIANYYYNADLGVDNTLTGHGIYAEDVGAKLDVLAGDKAKVVGRDNAVNGPDKIVNGVNIQCKYYGSASRSLNACFDDKGYRYINFDGTPMEVEVPADQYADAVILMRQKINEGKVPNISDPNSASEIVRKGKLTYTQARNLAKSGTIESLSFDAVNNAVNSLSAFGVSAAVSFAFVYWQTKSIEVAAREALKVGAQVFGTSFVAGVLVSQLARSSVPTFLYPVVKTIGKIMGPKAADSFINFIRLIAGKKAIHGAAAQKHFVKFLATNAITSIALFVVFSIPDAYRLFNKRVSKEQFLKNTFSLIASMIGGTAGAAIGMKIGQPAGWKGLVGGTVGGFVVGAGVRSLLNLIREDDAIILGRLINSYIAIEVINNMLSDDEQKVLVDLLNKDIKGMKKLVGDLMASNSQEETVLNYLKPYIEKVTEDREKILIEDESKGVEYLCNEFEGGVQGAM